MRIALFVLLALVVFSVYADPRTESRGGYSHIQPDAGNADVEIFLSGCDSCSLDVDANDEANSLFVYDVVKRACADEGNGTHTAYGVTLEIGETHTVNNGNSAADCTLIPGNGNTYTADYWTSNMRLDSASGGTCWYKMEISCRHGERIETE